MNKVFKKIISAAAAITMSASSITAFAVNFPDIPADADYAQAVSELSALGIINGFDDGTFKPDELVTRAQISTMIVAALAETPLAEASKTSSKFTDVASGEGGHWAVGYINQGTSDGWISGMGDGTFAPDDNVSFVQAQKMLVAAIGYDSYAQAQGGWPSGYKRYASTLDMTKGISGVTDDTQLTRAQVAKMINNAMDAPLCEIDSYEPNAWNNTANPTYTVKDGTGRDYQTLFTRKHNAFKVYGRVTKTNKSSSSDIPVDKVMFKVEKADNFDDEYIKDEGDMLEQYMYYGNTYAENMTSVYAEALIRKNDSDEYTILSIVPAAADESVTLYLTELDYSRTNIAAGGNLLYFFPIGKKSGPVKYELCEDGVDLYVNGVYLGEFDENRYFTYMMANDTISVTLQKTTKPGSKTASSDYNTMMITSYATAIVEDVEDKASQTRINFKDQTSNAKPYMEIDKFDDTKRYSFIFNGAPIEPTELQEYDVLSIMHNDGGNPTDTGNFADSDFYDVLVSRNVIDSAKCTSATPDSAGKYTFGSAKYWKPYGMDIDLEELTNYTLYLDIAGRIAHADDASTSEKIGILKNVYREDSGDFAAEIIDKNAQVIKYTIKDEDALAVGAYFTGTEQRADSTFKSGLGNTTDDYVKQVVEYKTTKSGRLTIKEYLTAEKDAAAEYRANSSKLGSLRISDAASIIDLSGAREDDYSVISKDSLKDGVIYEAYGYSKSTSDKSYKYVLVTDGIGGIDSASELAVFVEAGMDTDDDGNDIDTMTVLFGGEKVTLTIDDDADIDAASYAEGDALIFSTNTAGEIDEVLPVFGAEVKGTLAYNYATFRDNAAFRGTILNTETVARLENIADGSVDEGDVILAFGAVVKDGGSYTLAKIENDGGVYIDLANYDGNIDLEMSNAIIYTYNFSNNPRNGDRLLLDADMAATPKVTAAYETDENGDRTDIYRLDDESVIDDIVFAVVRAVDDEVREIYLITAE